MNFARANSHVKSGPRTDQQNVTVHGVAEKRSSETVDYPAASGSAIQRVMSATRPAAGARILSAKSDIDYQNGRPG